MVCYGMFTNSVADLWGVKDGTINHTSAKRVTTEHPVTQLRFFPQISVNGMYMYMYNAYVHVHI